MIIRIVKMEFRPDGIETFSEVFSKHRLKIRNVPGCTHLELLGDANNPYIRYTYSLWESEEALNAYRKSEVFKDVWPKAKALFAAKPQAFSMIKMD